MRMLTLLLSMIIHCELVADGMINPITDICWECLFPITVSGVNVFPGTQDLSSHNERICVCPGVPPKVGVPLTFWEPMRLVDVTRHAFKLIGLGGIQIGQESVRNRGSIGYTSETTNSNSFYHVHWYEYPILSILGVFTDFSCMDKGGLDVAYMSEFDPTWNDDTLSAILNPEAGLFGNQLAHLSCVADCISSSSSFPNDALFGAPDAPDLFIHLQEIFLTTSEVRKQVAYLCNAQLLACID